MKNDFILVKTHIEYRNICKNIKRNIIINTIIPVPFYKLILFL